MVDIMKTKVYPLSNIARRIKKIMANISIAVAMGCFPIGVTLFVFALGGDSPIQLYGGLILVALGVVFFWVAISQQKMEDEKREISRGELSKGVEKLIEEVRGLREDHRKEGKSDTRNKR